MNRTLLCIVINILLFIGYWCVAMIAYRPKGSDDMMGLLYLFGLFAAHIVISLIIGIGLQISGYKSKASMFWISAVMPVVLGLVFYCIAVMGF